MSDTSSSNTLSRLWLICSGALFVGASLFLLLTAPYIRAQIDGAHDDIADLYNALQTAERLTYGVVESTDGGERSLVIALMSAFGETRSLHIKVGPSAYIAREALEAHNGVYDALTRTTASFADIAPGDRVAVLLSGDLSETRLVLFGNPL